MICPNCGTDGDGVFCAGCGAKLPAGSDMELSPAALRRAAEKAAEEAETMRRRYEEAAEAAKAMLRAVEAEETAAAKARAEREESLRRAVMEAEALLSDKTAKLEAARNEQKAAEKLLAERRAAMAELQTSGKTPENRSAPVYTAWNAKPDFMPTIAPVQDPMRITPEPDRDLPRIQPDISRTRQESAWPRADLPRQPLDKPRGLPETPNNNPIPRRAQSDTSQSWIDTSSRMESVKTQEPAVWQTGSSPPQSNVSPWTPPPEPSQRWATGSDPPQAEIWNTIVKNTPRDPDAENVLRKAAGYWKDSPPLQAPDVRAPVPDPRERQPQPDPWGLGSAGIPAWQANEQQRAKQTADNNPQLAVAPRTSVKQREEKSKRPSKTHSDDYDEDNESEYEDDIDEGYEDDEEAGDKKPSFLSGILSAFKLGSKSAKKDDDEDEDYDDEDEDYDDEEDEDEDYDDDEEDDDEGSGNGGSKLPKWILIGLAVVVVIVALSLGIGKLLQGPLRNLIGGNEPASTEPAETSRASETVGMEDPPVIEDPASETPPLEASVPPAFVDPGMFGNIAVSAISATKEGRLAYCCTDPVGIFLLADDYSGAVKLTDMPAYNAVYDPPWIYFSAENGIFRVRQDSSDVPEQIIYESYESPHKFYIYNNYVYFTYKNEDGSWSVHRSNLAEMDNPDTGGPREEEELIANVDPDFYMDAFGVYAFADESVEHPGVPVLFAEPASPPQQPEEGVQRKNVYFSSIIEGGNYHIGTLYMDRFVASRSNGVIVQTTESGVIKEYMISWHPNQSDYASREVFDGADGAKYELRTNDRGSYALYRQAGEDAEKQLTADDIEPDVYTIYNNTMLYYLTLINNSYKLMEYDFRSQDMAPKDVIDFGAYDQDVVNIAGKLERGDTSFDKIILDSESDIIFFAGMVISADRRLFISNRTTGVIDTLSPAL
ncbi:MAG: hypothetical protein LBS84_02785 [Clostridiales bacterium]|jgi:hypothetical protein|nr:hypothetical protein [Clostridiales bacterium]